MEAVQEPPLHNPPLDGLKISVTSDESNGNAVASVESDVCHKSNGVADLSEAGKAAILEDKNVTADDNKVDSKRSDGEVVKSGIQNNTIEPAGPYTSKTESSTVQTVDSSSIGESITCIAKDSVADGVLDNQNTEIKEDVCITDAVMDESIVEAESVVETTLDRVTFETEILVESNDNEIIETETSNILSELGENIVLSEALRSSDVTDNVENNNCSGRQEVFNKEELLDILQGNDEQQPGNYIPPTYPPHSDKFLETQLALQQLSRLKKGQKKPRSIERLSRKSKSEKRFVKQGITSSPEVKNEENIVKNLPPEVKNEENIVKNLVKEWDDEEGPEVEKSNKPSDDSDSKIKSSTEVENLHDSVTKQDRFSVRTSVDSQTTDEKMPNQSKGVDDGQPQRRLGRVIKKKVIFDPDNPDTFAKSKFNVKNKEHGQEKEQAPIKKLKQEPTFQRSKSKSPLSKLQWKKPSPKNIKQNKRLTEVDKLLMDEGAVNMIYQLTPEAPKGKKNMKTKAEFIKKIQSSSTPDTKEMKFRERKKESKYEESEARRILGGKHRPSLNSSVKSPSVSEDFEAHSADDSIIYRRHSSSSYSSSCMSPRRLSDVDMSNQAASRNSHQIVEVTVKTSNDTTNDQETVEMFIPDTPENVRTETINKSDCLSIKEKLNSKLNLALNKRKRDNSKPEKPSKPKKIIKTDKNDTSTADFKHLTIKFDAKLAVICVLKPGTISNMETIKELEKALKLIESKKDISMTFITPECEATYSDLDLRTLLDDDLENKRKCAFAIAETIRSLLHTVEQHNKLLCTGASGSCSGIALALIGLSDVALASERASFAVTAKPLGQRPVGPGVSVLTAYCNLPQALVTDLVLLGRRLSASEALQSGLVSRTIWPEKFNEQALAIAKDIAAQPAQNIWLKKQILNLKKIGSESTFLERLEKERDLFVEYWTSVEGQELLRATYKAA